jgi:predicted RNA binding protein YcfA (HicA-like mRNA interferase family)
MPIRYSSSELIRIITKDGWYLVTTKGSHHKYRHPRKTGTVIVPHPKGIVPQGTALQILKDAGCIGRTK